MLVFGPSFFLVAFYYRLISLILLDIQIESNRCVVWLRPLLASTNDDDDGGDDDGLEQRFFL